MIELSAVPSAHVEAVWPLVKRHLDRALAYGDGEFTLDDIRRLCRARDMQLFVVGDGKGIHGAGVTQIVRYPRKLYLDLVLWAADRPLDEYLHLFAAIEHWAKTLGAIPRLFGRRGWGRKLPNYRATYTVFVRSP